MMFLIGSILGGLVGYGIGVVKTRYQLGTNLLNKSRSPEVGTH